MEVQWLINAGFTLAGAFGMWILTRLTNSVDKIEDSLKELPHRYVARDDYHRDIDHIKEMLNDIYRELRSKVDK